MMVKRLWRVALTLGLGLTLSTTSVAGQFQEGTHYKSVTDGLPSSEPGVIEFFSYACPHCYSLEPTLEGWVKSKPADVKFTRVPVIFRASWEVYAKAYFVGEALGILDKSHPILFHQIHNENAPLKNDKQLKKFFEGIGVKGEDFDKTAGSFTVATKLNQARQAMAKYKIASVPSFIINEKYQTSLSLAKTPETLTQILSQVPGDTVARFPLQP